LEKLTRILRVVTTKSDNFILAYDNLTLAECLIYIDYNDCTSDFKCNCVYSILMIADKPSKWMAIVSQDFEF